MLKRETIWWGALIVGLLGVVGYGIYQVFSQEDQPSLPEFHFLTDSGELISAQDLRGRISVVGFFFSCCQASCPKICQAMQELQRQLRNTDARLVLISVDPETDRPERLREVAKSLGANPRRWWFLTTTDSDSERLFTWIEEAFGPATRPKRLSWYYAAPRGWDIAHSNRLFLLDRRGRLRDSELVVRLEGEGSPWFEVDEEAVARLAQKVRRLDSVGGIPVRWLPTLNVGLNATSLVLLLAGFVAIKMRRVFWHRSLMLAAATVSALFLLSYLYYHWQVGHTRYPGSGWDRMVYLVVLMSHVVLAAALAILVPLVLWFALLQRWEVHRRLARLTWPIWIYVCASGIAVYVMLYVLNPQLLPF
ncbi:MAG: DUF420 domain-containing protein [Gemmatales bacterium]|nr:DUF420 domain-containing protein [Gemmatales bacterium]MDW7994569.1 DUF420 domain-containing protein [Gemmatales bacterium]